MWTRASSFTCGLARRPRRPGRRSSGRSRRRAATSSSAKLASWTSSSASARGRDGRLAGRGVAGDRRSCGPGAARAHHLLGRRPARRRPRPPRRAAGRRRRGLRGRRARCAASGSKRPGPLVLDQRVAVGAHAVLDLEGADLVARRARSRRPARARPGRASKPSRPISGREPGRARVRPARPVDRQRHLRGRSGRRSSAAPAGRGSGRRGSGSGRSRPTWTRPSERCICRCVPSPQSNSSRSPPRATSTLAVERRAEGTEPPVPRKVTARDPWAASLRDAQLRANCRSSARSSAG